MPNPPAPDTGFSDSDQQWFDRLSGKPGPYTDERAVLEADALRLALELEHERLDREADAGAAAEGDEVLAHEWQRLRFALKREGVLERRPRPRWLWPALGGMAAAVVLSVALVPLWRESSGPIYDAPPTLRGPAPVRHVPAAAPREAAERFARNLREAALKPGLYQKDASFIVDVVVPPGQLEAARPAFQQFDLAPAPGLNRLIFDSR